MAFTFGGIVFSVGPGSHGCAGANELPSLFDLSPPSQTPPPSSLQPQLLHSQLDLPAATYRAESLPPRHFTPCPAVESEEQDVD